MDNQLSLDFPMDDQLSIDFPIEPDERSACVSEAFRYLKKRRNVTIREIAKAIDVPETTLYSINGRACDRANMGLLKSLADFFHVDVSIFCGLKDYKPPVRLTSQQKELLNRFGELTEDAQRRVLENLDDIYSNPKNHTQK